MDEQDDQFSTSQTHEHEHEQEDTVFSVLPPEILIQIYLHASVSSNPVILPPQLSPTYDIDLRFLEYNSDHDRYHDQCLLYALRHNVFTILPFNVNQYASPTLREIEESFVEHELFFRTVRHLRLRLRSPLFQWPSRAEALRQQERYSRWYLDCRFLHRFKALTNLEFEHMVCLRDWCEGEGEGDAEAAIETWSVDAKMKEAVRRAEIGFTPRAADCEEPLSKTVSTEPPKVSFVFDRITKFRSVDRHHVFWVRMEMVKDLAELIQNSVRAAPRIY